MSNKTDSPERDEKELIDRLKEGQEKAYRSLVLFYQERLLRVAYGITLDTEESREIVQEVFLKVYSHIASFKGDSKLYTWLRRITVNQSLNWVRKWKRRFRWHHQSLEDDTDKTIEPGGSYENPEALYSRKEQGNILNNALKSLPEDARTIYMLKEIEGLSYDEIAGLLNIKKGTVSSRIFYARKKLKAFLEILMEDGDQ